MKKLTENMFAENPNVEAFVIFHGSFKPFYLSINKGAPIEKRIKSILKPDGYAWAEDIAYNCEIIVIPQSKKAYDAFIAYILSTQLWAKRLQVFNTQVLPYERSSFRDMNGGMYFCPNDDTGKGWMRSFISFGPLSLQGIPNDNISRFNPHSAATPKRWSALGNLSFWNNSSASTQCRSKASRKSAFTGSSEVFCRVNFLQFGHTMFI